MKKIHSLILALCAAVLLAACSSTPETVAPVETRTTTGTQPTSTDPGASTTGVGTSGLGAATNTGAGATTGATMGGSNALRDPRNPLSRREIFYDLDSYTVRDEYKPLLEAHAAYLKANRSARIKVEGNTDERGSREYNLSLGQKRSESVKRVLTLLGVSDTQIDTVSFGEEKPRNPASNESAYSENRRCDLAYAGE